MNFVMLWWTWTSATATHNDCLIGIITGRYHVGFSVVKNLHPKAKVVISEEEYKKLDCISDQRSSPPKQQYSERCEDSDKAKTRKCHKALPYIKPVYDELCRTCIAHRVWMLNLSPRTHSRRYAVLPRIKWRRKRCLIYHINCGGGVDNQKCYKTTTREDRLDHHCLNYTLAVTHWIVHLQNVWYNIQTVTLLLAQRSSNMNEARSDLVR